MDPHPYKHPAIMLARIREALEPSILAAGFRFEVRNNPQRPVHLFLDYVRGRDCFRIAWDRRESDTFIGFTAELIQEPDCLVTVVATDLTGVGPMPSRQLTAEITRRLDLFVLGVRRVLDDLPPVPPDSATSSLGDFIRQDRAAKWNDLSK